MLSNMFNLDILLRPPAHIHTPPLLDLANTSQAMESPQSPHTLTFHKKVSMLSRTLLLKVQSPLLLRLTKLLSNTTPVVLLPLDVDPLSITVSLPSDMEPTLPVKDSSLSRTNGDLTGVMLVTSRSVTALPLTVELVSVVSS